MLISHSRKFIYIKTIKTAGTSTEMVLQKFCLPPDVDAPPITDCIETDHGIVGARGPKVSGQKWWNHMPAYRIRRNIEDHMWSDYLKICNIRNPWDKTVSFFHMRHPRIKNEPKDRIIDLFHEWIPEADEIGADTRIYFMDGVPVADEYIRYQNLKEDLAALSHKMGIDIEKDLPREKVEARGKNKIPYQDYYDNPSRAVVEKVYEKEIEHFNWTFD